MKKIIVSLTMFNLFIIGCNINDAETENVPDQRLIGDWYYFDTSKTNYPAPDISFIGIRFNDDYTQDFLGIETVTGKVALLDIPSVELISVTDEMIVRRLYEIPCCTVKDTLYYSINDDKLTISDNISSHTYHRTAVGTKMVNPIQSELFLNYDGEEKINIPVASSPTAYISKPAPDELILMGRFETPSSYLQIKIIDFIGPGFYEIQDNDNLFTIMYDDVIMTYSLDSLIDGNIQINQYDETLNICSGTFYFGITPSYEDSLIISGQFNVPVYK